MRKFKGEKVLDEETKQKSKQNRKPESQKKTDTKTTLTPSRINFQHYFFINKLSQFYVFSRVIYIKEKRQTNKKMTF